MIQRALARLLDGHDLSREEAHEVMGSIMSGEATPAQIAGFLIALRAKGETADEIAGCAEAMREHALPVRPQRDDLVDTAGTGGDGAGTINISTAAALVAAAAGAGVAKHGNRAVSSACGSADVLEALGFELDLSTERVARSIDELGFGFLFAPTHHPAMRHAAPVRSELAARTGLQRARPAHEPGWCTRSGGRRLRARARADNRRGTGAARCDPRLRRSRRRWDRRALACRAELRLRGRERRGTRPQHRPARIRTSAVRPERPAGRVTRRQRRRDPRRLRGRGRRPAERDPAERRRRDRGRRTRRRPARGARARQEAVDSGAAAARLDELIMFSQGEEAA
jgi:hypothetical protein